MEDFIQSINVKIKLFILNQGYSQTNWQLFTKGYGSVFVFSFVIKPSPLQLEVPLEPASTLLVVLACTGCKPECSHGPRLPGGCLFNLYSYPQEQRACVVSLILCIACTDLIYKKFFPPKYFDFNLIVTHKHYRHSATVTPTSNPTFRDLQHAILWKSGCLYLFRENIHYQRFRVNMIFN